MLDIVSVKNMRESERALITGGTPSLELMRRAGLVLYHALSWKGNIAIAVGQGNNGGDGFALATFLAAHGFSPSIYMFSDTVSDDSYFFEKQCRKKSVPIMPYVPKLGLFDDADIIVDCLFGTGFHGVPEGLYATGINEINASPAKVVSADINSGFNGDEGPTELAVKSDVTVTIGSLKMGLLRKNYKDYIKNITVGEIGIPLLREENYLLSSEEWNDIFNKWVKTDEALFYFEKDGHRYYRKPQDIGIKEVSYRINRA